MQKAVTQLTNEDIDPTITDIEEQLTTIIAIRCPDGIVIASDSQTTELRTKTLDVTKVSLANDFMAVGGSGDADNIRLFIEHLKQEFAQASPTEPEFRAKIENLLLRLHKKYNLDTREYLGKDVNPFQPNLVVATKNGDDSFGLYLLRANGMVYHIDQYRVIGTGDDLARLVIKQLNRSLERFGQALHTVPVELSVRFACYIINEVKESDNKSGGITKVVVINASGLRELSDDEVQSYYKSFIDVNVVGFSKLFEGSGLSNEDLRKMFPKP
jgi:20S proteasome alpha/beta subunit